MTKINCFFDGVKNDREIGPDVMVLPVNTTDKTGYSMKIVLCPSSKHTHCHASFSCFHFHFHSCFWLLLLVGRVLIALLLLLLFIHHHRFNWFQKYKQTRFYSIYSVQHTSQNHQKWAKQCER